MTPTFKYFYQHTARHFVIIVIVTV
jgi:hypothetical protein